MNNEKSVYEILQEKLEEQNKTLLDAIHKKDKIHAILISLIVTLQCILFGLGIYSYFWSPYLDYNYNSITGDNNTSLMNNNLEEDEIDINTSN